VSIIVSVKINDGIVLAADSATTFYTNEGRPGQIYEHANKIVKLVKGLPIGVMTCGSGSIGNAAIATLLKDLRVRLSKAPNEGGWALDPANYTMESISGWVYQFFAERAQEADFKFFLMLRICGYSSGSALPEVWEVKFDTGRYPDKVVRVRSERDIGLLWDGEYEA
jgi:hypothetical protein